MASIILSTVGSTVGSYGGPIGSAIGAKIGQTIGQSIDNAIFGRTTKLKPYQGPRLADLAVQSSTYGKMIPVIYGTVRIGGNIIWSRPIKETATTTTQTSGGGKGGGGKVSQTSTTYSYSITLAIGICEGAVDEVLRIWADAKQLDLSQYTVRIYTGDETQLPDSIIQSFEGVDNTPAYRGMAYVVFEDFPMADYGNRIPNFTFEVKKRAVATDYNDETVEELITGMVMIPGAGEFVYDTQVEYKVPGEQVGSDWAQQGNNEALNMHNASGQANALLSLDQLENTCPNVGWVSVVACWFGTDMDAGSCVVLPGVEYQSGATTSPDTWQSAGFTRDTAHLISYTGGSPQYGGTPDDDSILRYLDELRDRGYQIAFYPLMFMDVPGKLWRGLLTGSAADVASFFTKTNGYNEFITHYANLVHDKVDAFIIGSELIGLTKVTDTPGNYPAVNELVSLASTVKGIVGSGVKVTYAADWSEYHHTDGGWYNLDPLWASSDIDVIGIDAYFPLTDSTQNIYDIDTIKAGWTSGEGYDYYYDGTRTTQNSLSAPYAWKNLAWFWSNTHTNPDSSTTSWVPESKKIWFTEYGFPSVDHSSNQPNVFYDPTSAMSAFPYYSKGRVDFRAQRSAIMATLQQWKDSDMVERMFLWTWDARPYPYWPDLTGVWTDGAAWKTGHWVEGKLGISGLAAIIRDLCHRAGLSDDDIDLSQIGDQVEGFVISAQQTIRSMIETLQLGYFFDTVESDYQLKFVPRGGESLLTLTESELLMPQGDDNVAKDVFLITRTQEVELPKHINVVYLNRMANYQSSTQHSQREVTLSRETKTIDLPIVFSDQLARNIADISLYSYWMGRTGYQFDVPAKYMRLEPSDVISVTVSGITHRMRIVTTRFNTPGALSIMGIAEDVSTFDFYNSPGIGSALLQPNNTIPKTRLELLDIPALPGDDSATGFIRFAACGLSSGWTGAGVYRSDDGGTAYNRLMDLNSAAAIGTAADVLADGSSYTFDRANSVTVSLIGDTQLESVTELAVLNGANAALLGDEIIQFSTATLVSPGKYTISGLLRGRLGTEWATSSHSAGERFIMLDGRIGKQIGNTITGLPRSYKGITFGATLTSATSQSLTYSGVALKPYNPVHITGSRDGSNNLTINWVRRTRIGGNWLDAVDVPLGESSEAYEVDILNGSSVVRTISGLSSPTTTYSAADQTTDFGSPQSSVDVRVYQLSGIVGRGYAGVASV